MNSIIDEIKQNSYFESTAETLMKQTNVIMDLKNSIAYTTDITSFDFEILRDQLQERVSWIKKLKN